MQQFVRDVMTEDPVVLPGDSSLNDAARAMRDRGIGAVVVEAADGSICGIVTDRDIVVRALAEDADPEDTTLDEICSRDLITLAADELAERAVAVMRERGIRRILIEDDGEPVGIVSLGDLARDRDQTSVLAEISSKPANR
jgi:CBS domain-containing protein